MGVLYALGILILIVASIQLFMRYAYASDLRSDEEVILFPTNAALQKNGRQWYVPVHGWIYEPESDSIWRKALVGSFVQSLGLDESEQQSRLLRERLRMFLVDNERSKALWVSVANSKFRLNKSTANGHFHDALDISEEQWPRVEAPTWVPVRVHTPAQDTRRFEGQVQLLPEEGISVVSDIDDTIKHSNVLDKSELIRNTFLRPFAPIEGMAESYRQWAQVGAAFHYVSSSPWQLYPALSEFMRETGLPAGSFHLKYFRPKDESFFNLFKSPLESKVPVIENLLTRFPKRGFILVGDAGERDPEVYAVLLAKHPRQIRHVFIRALPGMASAESRYEAAYPGAMRDKLTVFERGAQLQAFELDGI